MVTDQRSTRLLDVHYLILVIGFLAKCLLLIMANPGIVFAAGIVAMGIFVSISIHKIEEGQI